MIEIWLIHSISSVIKKNKKAKVAYYSIGDYPLVDFYII